jgi:cobalamin biosynthesis Mg chelatase CobN
MGLFRKEIMRKLLPFVVIAAQVFTAGVAAASSTPYIRLAPAGVTPGERYTVYGQGFCASSDCTSVRLSARDEYSTPDDERLVADGVTVSGDGTLQHTAAADLEPGRYQLFATQHRGDEVMSASATLTVHPPDEPAGSRQGGVISTGTTEAKAANDTEAGKSQDRSIASSTTDTHARSASSDAAGSASTAPSPSPTSTSSALRDDEAGGEAREAASSPTAKRSSQRWLVLLLAAAGLAVASAVLVRRRRSPRRGA